MVYSVLGRGSYVMRTCLRSPAAGGTQFSHGMSQDQEAEHDPRPPHVRTADTLREEIRSGELGPGERVPSARELQDRFTIANSTAQNAVRVLKREGLVFAVKGRGVFVRPTVGEEQAGTTGKLSAGQGVPADGDLDAQLAAAEQRLARAADTYRNAAAEVEILTREAHRRGLLPLAPARGATTPSSSTA
ncbi:GntR family transcriptional regulator [Streptomyces sp. NBC_00045]|uniref:GntR family transcriptional regulator n=1 Tax=Streptomyces sp. NBC_00045 TaxID=2975625 RepID=UPI00324DB5A1